MTRLGWMAHPLSGDIPGNIAKAKAWLGWLLRTFSRIDFAADWILWCEVLDDTIPAERARGLNFDNMMINRMTDYWMVGGRLSNGMQTELVTARAAGCEIVDLTCLGTRPPTIGSVTWWDLVPADLQQRLLFLLNDEMVRKVEERL